jgi:hypothetical protein
MERNQTFETTRIRETETFFSKSDEWIAVALILNQRTEDGNRMVYVKYINWYGECDGVQTPGNSKITENPIPLTALDELYDQIRIWINAHNQKNTIKIQLWNY